MRRAHLEKPSQENSSILLNCPTAPGSRHSVTLRAFCRPLDCPALPAWPAPVKPVLASSAGLHCAPSPQLGRIVADGRGSTERRGGVKYSQKNGFKKDSEHGARRQKL